MTNCRAKIATFRTSRVRVAGGIDECIVAS